MPTQALAQNKAAGTKGMVLPASHILCKRKISDNLEAFTRTKLISPRQFEPKKKLAN